MGDNETKSSGKPDGRTAGSDVAVLRSGRDEARVVLDHQLRLLNETQKKVMRTTRVTGLIFGLILSAATLPGARRFVNGFTVGGIGCLVVTILVGLLAYGASNPELGVGAGYLRDARSESYTESEWFDLLVSGYREWITEMERLNGSNSILLVTTQLFLGLGVVFLIIGVVVTVLVN
jgi:hypothetical protein